MIRTFVRSVVITALAVAVVGIPQAARAEEKKAEKRDLPVMKGEIDSVDVKAGTVTIKHKLDLKTFTLATDAKIVGEGRKDITLAELKAGDRIAIHYSEKGGKLIAHKIGHADPAPKAEAAPQTTPPPATK